VHGPSCVPASRVRRAALSLGHVRPPSVSRFAHAPSYIGGRAVGARGATPSDAPVHLLASVHDGPLAALWTQSRARRRALQALALVGLVDDFLQAACGPTRGAVDQVVEGLARLLHAPG
jgi:hypothetical protein